MTELQPNQILFQMLTGAWVTKSLGIVAELGVADHLTAGPREVEAIAAEVGARPDELYRVLRMLAGVGLFVEHPGRVFENTPVSALLATDRPDSLRSMTRMLTFGEHWNAWTKMLDVVRNGGIATDLAEGCDIWAYFRNHPDRAAIFDAAMSNFSAVSNLAVAEAFDFGKYSTICDVGGGHGTQIEAILKAYPGVRGIVFDQEYVVEGARKHLAAAGLADRTMTVGGNFFESVVALADVYIAKNIIHDWDDEKSITILRNIRKVVPANGRVLLLEVMVGPANVPDPGKFMDINMMAMTGGRERTAGEFAALFAASGFTLGAVIPTKSPVFIVEGIPAH
jgi:hypothetical protein